MADANSTARPQQTEDNRRTGALAAHLALLALEKISEYTDDGDETPEEFLGGTSTAYLRQRGAAIQAVVKAAGPLPPFLEGFVETLAYYAHDCLVVGTPNLLVWKSEAAMTAQEFAINRARLAEGDEELRSAANTPADKEVAHV